jgi:hypothetical protein
MMSRKCKTDIYVFELCNLSDFNLNFIQMFDWYKLRWRVLSG